MQRILAAEVTQRYRQSRTRTGKRVLRQLCGYKGDLRPLVLTGCFLLSLGINVVLLGPPLLNATVESLRETSRDRVLASVEKGKLYVGEMAVVFNSGSMLAQDLGDEIDRHHYVLRFDFAWPDHPAPSNRTRHVGQRTTHMLFGPHFTKLDLLFNETLPLQPRFDKETQSNVKFVLTHERSVLHEEQTRSKIADSALNPHGQQLVILPRAERVNECRNTFNLRARECQREADGHCSCSTSALLIHHFLKRHPMLFKGIHKLSLFGFRENCHFRNLMFWWSAGAPVLGECAARPPRLDTHVHDVEYENSYIEELARLGELRIVS